MMQLCEGLLGLATVNIGKDDMAGAKKLLTRSLEIALEIFGKKHHFVAAIFTKVTLNVLQKQHLLVTS